MKFLGDIGNKNLMLINTLYHRATKENDYCDFMDIIYKDLDTDSKHLVTIKNPQMEIFFAREEARNYTHNRNFIEIPNAYSKIVPYKSLEMEIAKEAGDNYVKMIQECRRNRNMSAIRNIHKYRYVFASDYDIENWYKIQWMLEYENNKPKKITKQYLDIEVDSIDTEGFPKDGECPINAVTIVDEESMTSYTFLLRNEKNPQIEEFEKGIDSFIEELHEAFDETYGRLEYKFYMYDEYNEIGLIKDMFKLINTLKRDFLMIWNMDFDANFIIDRIKVLGYDPLDIICHKDFKIKQVYYHKDRLNFDVKNKADYFKVSSYTVYIDQMLSYIGLRKGQGELRSHALNAVARDEIGDEKLDYSEDANIKTLPYVNYKKFVMYNIKDVLLQMGIERKTSDVEGIYDRALVNATSYHKVFKQTVLKKTPILATI